MKETELLQGDCLELMKNIPDRCFIGIEKDPEIFKIAAGRLRRV